MRCLLGSRNGEPEGGTVTPTQSIAPMLSTERFYGRVGFHDVKVTYAHTVGIENGFLYAEARADLDDVPYWTGTPYSRAFEVLAVLLGIEEAAVEAIVNSSPRSTVSLSPRGLVFPISDPNSSDMSMCTAPWAYSGVAEAWEVLSSREVISADLAPDASLSRRRAWTDSCACIPRTMVDQCVACRGYDRPSGMRELATWASLGDGIVERAEAIADAAMSAVPTGSVLWLVGSMRHAPSTASTLILDGDRQAIRRCLYDIEDMKLSCVRYGKHGLTISMPPMVF